MKRPKLCEWVREVLESHDVYHPMAWTPGEAYQLLQSIPQLRILRAYGQMP